MTEMEKKYAGKLIVFFLVINSNLCVLTKATIPTQTQKKIIQDLGTDPKLVEFWFLIFASPFDGLTFFKDFLENTMVGMEKISPVMTQIKVT